MTSWLIPSIFVKAIWTKHWKYVCQKRKWLIALMKIEGRSSLRSKTFYARENCQPGHGNPWKFKATCQLFVFITSMPQIRFLGFSQRTRIFFHNYILAIKWVEDCSWAFPIQYADNDTVYLPPAKQCRRLHAGLWHVYAKTLDKGISTPSPLMLIKKTYVNSMVGNSERHHTVGAADKST